MEMKAEGLSLEELEAQVRTELLPDRIEMSVRRRIRKKRGFECGDDSTCYHVRHDKNKC
jgi:hypothetical protein